MRGAACARAGEASPAHGLNEPHDVQFPLAGQLTFGAGVLLEVLVHQRAVVELEAGDTGCRQVGQLIGITSAVVEMPHIDQ